MIENHNQGETNNFLYWLENTRKPNKPICNKSAVYLLLNANPMAKPAKIQYHFCCSKMALYKQIKLNVQNKSKGTSGVELNDKIETQIVEAIKIKALCNFCFDKK